MNARFAIPLCLLVPFLALTTWVLAHGGFVGFYREALSSPATLLMGLDLVIALGLALAWMREDARATGTPFVPYLLVTLAIGVAGPLLYLLHREARRGRGAAPAPARGGA